MTDDVIKTLKGAIEKAVEDLRGHLAKIRTGRANLGMLDGIKIDYYGTPTPLAQCAALAVPEPRLITVKPWDKSIMKDVEKAIREANLGLNPMSDGELIRLPIPPLTEERRKDIAKQVKSRGEDHRVAVRNERRDANERLKTLQKDKAGPDSSRKDP